MATIRDVAREAEVSVSTVSIVLNGQSEERKIPLRTQERVMQAVQLLKYQPNLFARKLRSVTEKEYTIALYWAFETCMMVLARVMQGIQQAIVESGQTINVIVRPFVSGKLGEDKALQGLCSYDAAIIASIGQPDLDYLEQNPPPIPLVVFNRRSELFSSVSVDNAAAGRLAAMQFLQKGITQICAVFHEESSLATGERRKSFLETCASHGAWIPEENILFSDETLSDGFEVGMRLIGRGCLPKAVYCDDDSIALGMISALRRNGIKVPGDVELVAIGMAPPDIGRYSVPSLTVVELPLEEMADASIRMLLDILNQKQDTSRYIQFDAKLLARDSCGPNLE